jgi:predicted NBD/HSP70 family sugar kinase/DNA-binding XRE family transcriptional regulator
LSAPRPQPKIANSETARDINRSLVLNAIRINQPLSRADLARGIGLQRSTVSLIVEQLIKEQWVVERGVGQLPRGRKPLLLTLNTEKAAIIGINLMPRVTKIALADLNISFHSEESFATLKDPKEMITLLTNRIRRMMDTHAGMAFEAIGVSLPGRVDRLTQKLVFAPNLGWRDIDLKTPLESATGLPVFVENAANACALSEVWSGPFAGVQDLVAVTVSEGIGTGIIANGHLVQGPSGAAGEFGHVCLDPDGPPCKCGSRGCWEVYASNAAAVRAYNQGMQAGSESSSRRRKPQAFASVRDFGDLLSLAERGDVTAGEVLERMGHYLGVGLAMLVNGLAPSVITIVGEVTRAWDRIGSIVQEVVRERAQTQAAAQIAPTDNSLEPRLRGTVALVLQQHFQPRILS